MRCHGSKSIVRTFFPVMLAFLLVFLTPWSADAHPLGNFSINHYSQLRVESDSIAVLYIIDMAEIPTFQEIPEIDADHDGRVSLYERRAYLARKSEELQTGLVLKVNGRSLPLDIAATDLLLPPGAGGLPTMKIGVRYRAGTQWPAMRVVNELEYRDTNFPGRAGWKEIVATEGGKALFVASSIPASDRSKQLSDYPADIINSPPQDLDAHLRFSLRDARSVVAGGPILRERPERDGASPLEATRRSLAQGGNEATVFQVSVIEREVQPRENTGSEGVAAARAGARAMTTGPNSAARTAVSTPDVPSADAERWSTGTQAVRSSTASQSAFTELITTRDLSVQIILLSLLVAFALGAFHALEPGHGKTVVAAYLVGSRGTAKHALLLGGIVTASHTFGVYLLGIVTLYLSKYILPERLYPWLGFVSGMTIVGMGLFLFLKYLRGGHGHTHDDSEGHRHGNHHHSHEQGEPHHHHGHSHGGQHHHHHSQPEIRREGGEVSYRELFALGITGGIIPCPAALVVLLSAISLNRVGFGLVLIVAFSVGLAVVLMGIGLLMVYARGIMATWSGEGRLLQRLPLVSSVVIAILGFAIALQALLSGGVLQLRL